MGWQKYLRTVKDHESSRCRRWFSSEDNNIVMQVTDLYLYILTWFEALPILSTESAIITDRYARGRSKRNFHTCWRIQRIKE